MRTLEDAERQLDDYLATGAAAMQVMDQKLAEARRMLRAAALSNGGVLSIYDYDVIRVDNCETTMWRDEENMCTRIEVRRKGSIG